MQIGKILGAGRFNVVREVTFPGTTSPHQRFVVKSLLRNNGEEETDALEAAAVDLMVEAKLLSQISGQHKNIIHLHGACTEGEQQYLILDRLETTLQEKLFLWRCRRKSTLGSSKSSSLRTFAKSGRRWSEGGDKSVLEPLSSSLRSLSSPVPELAHRLGMATDIASAFSFLHSRGIMHRDLKPANVGFDAHGNVKIFDFGFAREYTANSQQNMTGLLGTQRYMAPEIAKCAKHYDLSVDVYSFGILLWELCALERPFSKYDTNVKRFASKVHYQGKRPDMESFGGWTRELKSLLQNCWADAPANRPTFGEIVQELQSDQVLASTDDATSCRGTRVSRRSLVGRRALRRVFSSMRSTPPGSMRSMSKGDEGSTQSQWDHDMDDSDTESSIATFTGCVSGVP